MKPTPFKRPALALFLAGSALAAAVGAFAFSGKTQAQPSLTMPSACTCSSPTPLGNAGEIINCRCETLQCVFASARGATQSPALVCVK